MSEKKLNLKKIKNEKENEEKITYYEHDVVAREKDDEITVKKCKKRSEDFEFTYYNKKQYKEYLKVLEEEQPDVVPEELGFFKLTKKFKDKGDNIIDIKGNKFDVKDKKRNPFRGIAGYVKVSENKDEEDGERFIILTKLRLLLILFLGILLIGAGVFVFHPDSPVPTPELPDWIIDMGEDWTGQDNNGDEPTAITEYIEVPGYGEITITDKNKHMYLINPTDNTVYMQYTVLNGEKVVYKTNLVPPGKMIPWEVGKNLSKGEYSLTLKIATYDIETKAGCNGATQTFSLTVK